MSAWSEGVVSFRDPAFVTDRMIEKHTSVVVVVVTVAVILRTDVIHLVDTTALGAALDGAVARAGEPDDIVGVGRVAGAAEVLLVAKGLDDNGVVEGSFWMPVSVRSSCVLLLYSLVCVAYPSIFLYM